MLGKAVTFHLIAMLWNVVNVCGQQPTSFSFLDDYKKCVVTKDHCPNENITFYLYTRKTYAKPTLLNVGQSQTLFAAPFVKGRPLILLLHGYTGHRDFSPNTEIRPAYFRKGEYNIISVDYNPLAREPCYVQAVSNLPVVARCTAHLLDFLVTNGIFRLEDIHVIGFSLGAQASGLISNYLRTGRLKRITGLDPAKPLFVFASDDHRLSLNDAEFVDVIHTDVLQRGILKPCGHADFYVNGGIEQPGCKYQTNTSTGSCNHARAPEYYAESVNSRVGFWGFKCKEWVDWALGSCKPATSDELTIMGYDASNESRGLYFLYTDKEPPYAEGILPEFIMGDESDGNLEIVTEIN